MEDNSLDEIFGSGEGDNTPTPNKTKPKVFRGAAALIVIGVIVAITAVFVVGFFVGRGTGEQPSGFGAEQAIASEVYDILKENYIEDVSKDEYERLFAAGFASVLDRYTGLMYSQGGQLSNGVYGFTVQTDRYSVKTITHVVEGGSADGVLMRGDVLVAARYDGGEWVDIEHLLSDDFTSKAKESTTMQLKIRRDGEVIEVAKLTKGMPISESYAHYLDTPYAGFGYISLTSFDTSAAASFARALSDFVESGNNILILDVRGNPGGTNIELCRIVRHFIREPSSRDVVINIKTRKTEQKTYTAKQSVNTRDSLGNNIMFDNSYVGDKVLAKSGKPFKLIVLANDQSASATEAFIGNIIHYMDASDYMLLGESAHTFGKGIAQQDFPLESDPGVTLHVTIGKYYVLGAKGTPTEDKEFTIHGVGYPLDNEGIKVEIKANIFEENIIVQAVERAKVWTNPAA